MKTNSLKGGIYLNDRRGNPLCLSAAAQAGLPISPLRRKGRGSHPIPGPDFTNAGDNGRGEKFFARCLNSFDSNHYVINPTLFLGGR